jgi:hypothetical protein
MKRRPTKHAKRHNGRMHGFYRVEDYQHPTFIVEGEPEVVFLKNLFKRSADMAKLYMHPRKSATAPARQERNAAPVHAATDAEKTVFLVAIGALSIHLLTKQLGANRPDGSKASTLPGQMLALCVDRLYSAETRNRVFLPMISDMQIEWSDAIRLGETRRAANIRFGWYLNIGIAAVIQIAIYIGEELRLISKAQRVSAEKENE